MPKMGSFDTDSEALVKRVNSHEKYGTTDLNEWIFSALGVSAGDSVLDVGCGFGKQSLALLNMGCKVVAIDASFQSLERLKESGEWADTQLTVIHNDFDDVELPEVEFDCVVSSYAFYYSRDPERVLSKIHERMKNGGAIFICGPTSSNNDGMKSLLNKVGLNFGEGSAPFMEIEAPSLLEKKFGGVEKSIFENRIIFPSANEVWEYWSSHNMFDASIEKEFKMELTRHFLKNDHFVTTKVAIGLFAQKS